MHASSRSQNEARIREAIAILERLVVSGLSRDVRKSIANSIACLTDPGQTTGVRAANAIYILSEAVDDSNTTSLARVAIWRALSELEPVREP